MTSSSALEALIDMLIAVGLSEMPVVSPDAPGAILDRAFFVEEGSTRRQEEAGRGRPRKDGMRITETFTVILTHILNPAEGQRARVQAYNDMTAVRRTLSRNGTALTTEGAIFVGDVSRRRLQEGAVLEQRLSLAVSFNLDLRVE
jgi:hypothetical protein